MTDMIGDYEKWLRRLRRADYTVEQYIYLLRRMDREMPEGVVCCGGEDLASWIYDKPRADSTYSHYTTVVRGFGRWLVDQERLDFHTSDELPDVDSDSPQIRPATEAEFATIRSQAPDPWIDLYELGGWAGLRCIEMHNLKREDMNEQEMKILGKGSKWRTVPTHPLLWERFAARPSGPLARGRDGSPLSRSQVIQRGDYHLRKLVAGISMHQLRKRFATKAYKDSNHNIRLVQHLLGHRYVSTTQRYLGVDGDEAAAVVTGMRVAA